MKLTPSVLLAIGYSALYTNAAPINKRQEDAFVIAANPGPGIFNNEVVPAPKPLNLVGGRPGDFPPSSTAGKAPTIRINGKEVKPVSRPAWMDNPLDLAAGNPNANKAPVNAPPSGQMNRLPSERVIRPPSLMPEIMDGPTPKFMESQVHPNQKGNLPPKVPQQRLPIAGLPDTQRAQHPPKPPQQQQQRRPAISGPAEAQRAQRPPQQQQQRPSLAGLTDAQRAQLPPRPAQQQQQRPSILGLTDAQRAQLQRNNPQPQKVPSTGPKVAGGGAPATDALRTQQVSRLPVEEEVTAAPPSQPFSSESQPLQQQPKKGFFAKIKDKVSKVVHSDTLKNMVTMVGSSVAAGIASNAALGLVAIIKE